MTVAIRPAVDTDIPWMLDELRDFAQFYDSRHSLYPGDERATAKMHDLIANHFTLVAECDQIWPVGFVAGLIVPHFMNEDVKVLTEALWWVCPHHRNGRAALMLLNAFVAWGKANCDEVIFSAIEGKTNVKESSFLKRGFRLAERSYAIEVG